MGHLCEDYPGGGAHGYGEEERSVEEGGRWRGHGGGIYFGRSIDVKEGSYGRKRGWEAEIRREYSLSVRDFI